MDQIFYRPVRACPTCRKLAWEALGLLVGALKLVNILIHFSYRCHGVQETCSGGPGLISLCVGMTKNYDQVLPRQP